MDAEYHQGKAQWALQAGSKAKQRLEQPNDLGWKKRERTRQSHCKIYCNIEVRTRNGPEKIELWVQCGSVYCNPSIWKAEMAQVIRVIVALSYGLEFGPQYPRQATHKLPNSSSKRSDVVFWLPRAPAHTVLYRHTAC